ncbi:MAG: fasciclin domain-containing protein [Phycisphaerae bacterium]|nr:fasciclin domain-containing protein [Phycisphaerae bacterium]
MTKLLVAFAGLAAASALTLAEPPKSDKPAKPEVKAPAAPTMDIVDTAVGNKDFTTLVGALKAAGLVDALKAKDKKFTVFAPNNAAFAKLPKETLDGLMKPENKEALKTILLFHVIPAEVPAADVVKMSESSKTLQGTTFNIKVKDGKVQIGNEKATATVIATDIKCTNGIIHVLDTVIMPADKKEKEEGGRKTGK